MAVDAGLSRHVLTQLVRDGVVRPLVRGTYVDATTPECLPLRARALSFVRRTDAVVCGVTAASLFGIPALLRGAHVRPPLEVIRPEDRAAARRAGVRGRVAILGVGDCTDAQGVSVTSPVRTTVELARCLDRSDGLAYVDAMLRAGPVTKKAMRALLDDIGGFPWVGQGRELVGVGDGRAESAGESWTRLRWHDCGLPPLERQISICEAGREVARLDAGLEELRFGLEYDGERLHPAEPAALYAAPRRWLSDRHGWDILAVGKVAVLGRGYAFKAAIAERTGLQPERVPWGLRRRTYAYRLRRGRTA